MLEVVTVAAEAGAEPRYWIVYLLFIGAGILVGGTWSAYKAENRLMTFALGILAALMLAGALMWLIGEMK